MKTIKDSLFFWGVPYIRTYGCAVQAKNWEMVKPEKKAKIKHNIDKIAASVNQNKTPHVGIKSKLAFTILKKMHEAGWDSSPVEAQYWAEMGWFEKSRPWKKK